MKWSNYDQNSYNDQDVTKIYSIIKIWSKFIQWSKYEKIRKMILILGVLGGVILQYGMLSHPDSYTLIHK